MVFTSGILPASRDGVHLFIHSTAIGSVPRLSVHAIAYRWRLLPRGRRRRASSLQGSSSNGCCLFRSHHIPIFVRLSFFTPTFGMKCRCVIQKVVAIDSHIQRILLATEETATQRVRHIDLSNTNPARGHKEVRRSTGHIMVTTSYSNHQGSKSRHNPCQVGPPETIENLSASRRCLGVRIKEKLSGVLPVFQNLNYKVQRRLSDVLPLHQSHQK